LTLTAARHMMELMSAKTNKQKRQALGLAAVCAFVAIVGCVLPIAALHSGRSVSHSAIFTIEIMSLAFLSLVFVRLVFKK
jgi:hypothetical protein